MKWEKPSPKTMRTAASVGMVLVFCLSAAQIVKSGDDFEAQTADNDREIATLQEDIEALGGRVSESAASKNEHMHFASDAGEKVAELQSKYQDIDAVSDPDGVKGNAQALSEYFGDDDQIGRTPWFVVTQGDAKADWQFKSTYSAYSSIVPVIWTCYPSDNADALLGYVTAEFHADEGKFYDVEKHMTTNSISYSKAEGTDDKKPLDDLIDRINDADVESDPEQSAEDLQNNSDGRAWLKEQYEKEHGGE